MHVKSVVFEVCKLSFLSPRLSASSTLCILILWGLLLTSNSFWKEIRFYSYRQTLTLFAFCSGVNKDARNEFTVQKHFSACDRFLGNLVFNTNHHLNKAQSRASSQRVSYLNSPILMFPCIGAVLSFILLVYVSIENPGYGLGNHIQWYYLHISTLIHYWSVDPLVYHNGNWHMFAFPLCICQRFVFGLKIHPRPWASMQPTIWG